jgi:hypothetical protein
LVAWVCIGASVLGVVLLIIDALRERQRREAGAATTESGLAEGNGSQGGDGTADYPEEALDEGDEAAETADSASDADSADSVRDEHNTR